MSNNKIDYYFNQKGLQNIYSNIQTMLEHLLNEKTNETHMHNYRNYSPNRKISWIIREKVQKG